MLPNVGRGFTAFTLAWQSRARLDHVDQLGFGRDLLCMHVQQDQPDDQRRHHTQRDERDAQSQLHDAPSANR
jgi:hypothetical protein